MDSQSGQVVVVDDSGRTWTLDVCTGRWAAPTTKGSAPVGWWARLLYDPASDLTYAFDGSHIATYDVQTATWNVVNNTAPEVVKAGFGTRELVVMDAQSRTVYVYNTDTGDLHAYDLALNRWTTVAQGQPRPPAGVDALAVFDASVRRIVLMVVSNIDGATGQDLDLTGSSPTPVNGQTWTFDPGSAGWTKVDTSTPGLNFGYTVWGTEMTYDVASRKTVAFSDGVLAMFDPTGGTWTTVSSGTGWPPATPVADASVMAGPLSRLGHAVVDDLVNGRVLVLGGLVRTSTSWRNGSDAWAYRVGRDAWTEVVPAQPGQATTR